MSQTISGASALTFYTTHFDVISRGGQPWVRLFQIGSALQYVNPSMLVRVYQRHADEFTDTMTAVVKLPTPGGLQDTRLFSLRGAHLLAMLARTPVAKEFRRWVLDVLDSYADYTPSLHHRRWLVYFDHLGKEVIHEVPNDASVMTTKQFLKAIVDPDSMATDEELFDYAGAALKTLRERCEYHQSERYIKFKAGKLGLKLPS
jgi:hypothetical protein